MTDRKNWEKRKSVRHQVHDGQKELGKEKKCPSSGSWWTEMAGKREKVSVNWFMMDRKGWEKRKSVRHLAHDGQKWQGKEKKCPSSGS